MLRFRTFFFALTLVLLPLAASARTPNHADLWNSAEINWRDIKSGVFEASQTGKPVVMVFHATWCTACKKYRNVFQDKGVIEAAKDFVMILIDGDAEKEVNSAFSPDGTYVPRTIFLDAEGNIRSEFKGQGDPKYPHSIDVNGPAELLALMEKARAQMQPAKPALPSESKT
jgi:protein-disulfide reductase (glutathione)